MTNVVTFLRHAKDAGFWVYGAAGEAAASYVDTDLTGRVVIVAGAEGRGLRPLVARTCDALVSIPMEAPVESLNVSVAAALLLYEARGGSALPPPEEHRAAAGDGTTLYIVDGYNVLHALFRGADKEEIFARRDWLADRLAGFSALRVLGPCSSSTAAARAARAASRSRARRSRWRSPAAASPRTHSSRVRIAERPADVQVVVVSADQEVQRTATRAGVSRMTPPELAAQLAGGDEHGAGS